MQESDMQRDTVILIPTRNEEGTIQDLVRATRRYGTVVVVDDSTTATTRELAKAAGALVTQGPGEGIGMALRQGIMEMAPYCEYLVVIDAGGTHDYHMIPHLVQVVRDGQDVAIASRFAHKDHLHHGYRTWVSKAAAWCARWALDIDIEDATSGFRCYRADRANIAVRRCWAKGFAFQIQLLGSMVLLGCKYAEIPAQYKLTNSTFSWKMVLEGIRVVCKLANNDWDKPISLRGR